LCSRLGSEREKESESIRRNVYTTRSPKFLSIFVFISLFVVESGICEQDDCYD
jgi:hypothetical protein